MEGWEICGELGALSLTQKVDLIKVFILSIIIIIITDYENCNLHNVQYFTGVVDISSDSSDVELEEICPGMLHVQGRVVRGSRGGTSRFLGRGGQLGGRGEERSDVDTGEGTSRGPGELGSNFNPSRYEANKQSHKQRNKPTNNSINK